MQVSMRFPKFTEVIVNNLLIKKISLLPFFILILGTQFFLTI